MEQEGRQIIGNSVTNDGSISWRVRNRRYGKLLQLRQKGYFDQESIKLRHPLLYHLFVGQYNYKSQSTNCNFNKNNLNKMTMQNENEQQILPTSNVQQQSGLSQFLQSHLLNLQYKQLLDKQLTPELQQLMLRDNLRNQQQIRQFKRESQIKYRVDKSKGSVESEMGEQQQYLQGNMLQRRSISNQHYHPSTVSAILLSREQRQFQQQHLIQYCQQLFLQGKLFHTDGINYNQIDNDDTYDHLSQEDRDSEDKYFDQIQNQIEFNPDGDGETGIQDY